MEFCENGDLETSIRKHLKEKTKFTEKVCSEIVFINLRNLMYNNHGIHRMC